jgi:hypothetical protein
LIVFTAASRLSAASRAFASPTTGTTSRCEKLDHFLASSGQVLWATRSGASTSTGRLSVSCSAEIASSVAAVLPVPIPAHTPPRASVSSCSVMSRW